MTENKTESMPRKMCHEIATEAFHTFAQRLLDAVPELRGLGLILDWQIGNNNLPCGTIYFKKDAVHPQATMSMLEQSRKVFEEQVITVQNSIVALNDLYCNLLEKVNEAHKQAEESLLDKEAEEIVNAESTVKTKEEKDSKKENDFNKKTKKS